MLDKHLAHAGLQFAYLRQGVYHFVSDEMEAAFTLTQLDALLKYFHLVL
jgi:hypothetical protein